MARSPGNLFVPNSPLAGSIEPILDEPLEEELEVEVEEEPGEEVVLEEEEIIEEFDSNLAEFMEEDVLSTIANELIENFSADEKSRKDWKDAYTRGLDMLGMKVEDRTTPWPGACGVFHPMLTEAVVRFQAHAIMEIFPASGPVKTAIIGDVNPEKEKQAKRVENEMNYLLTEKMTEYRQETEQLLFNLPLAGSAFRKIYYDVNLRRPKSMFVPAEDFVVAYGTSDLQTATRYTQIMRKHENEIKKLQAVGFYRDVDLGERSTETNRLEEKKAKIEGEDPSFESDDRYTLLEMHVDMNLEGFDEEDEVAKPYIITIEKHSGTVLSIYRNWKEDDDLKLRDQYFVHYKYLPGLGFYGIGLIHLIGGLTKSATSILRQLVDAGTLNNLQAGFKTRGLRIKGDNNPLMPGEFRDVDIPGGALRDNIAFLPFKEPSTVLYQLLGNIVDEGRRIGSVTDMQIPNASSEAPVGTTLALMERSMKVMSAVQARLHASMRVEFRLLSDVIKQYMPAQYEYEVDDQNATRTNDFSAKIDVIPVSDPNAATLSQRLLQYQAAIQLAAQAPQLYNMPLLHRRALEVLGVPDADKIVELPGETPPLDPVSENMAILTGKPVKAYQYQDHEAHIQVHLAAAQDPKIAELVGQSPKASSIMGALADHVAEHVAFQYRRDIEKQMGVPLPPPEQPLPPDIENNLSQLTAEAAEKLLQKDKAEAAAKQAQEQMQDPVVQMQLQELEIKRKEVDNRFIIDQERIKLDREKLHSNERTKGAEIGVEIATNKDRISTERAIEGARLGVEIASDTARDKKEREMTERELENAKAEAEKDRQLQREVAAAQRAAQQARNKGGET